MGGGAFMLGSWRISFKLDSDGKPISAELNNNGDITRYIAESEWTPAAADLGPLAGEWYSEEASASVTFTVEGDKAFVVQRPTTRIPLRPLYKDHFLAGGGQVVWFTRDASGKIGNMHVGAGRMRDMPFARILK
jgi:hypothetical protein